MASIAIRRCNRTMPTTNFTPGWNSATLAWFIGLIVLGAGGLVGIYVTARYSLLGKILEMQEALRKGESDRANKVTDRFDLVETKLQVLERDLHESREETLAARNEILGLRNENADLRAQNVRLSTECESLRATILRLHPEGDMII